MSEGALPRPRSYSGEATGAPVGTAGVPSGGQSKLDSYLRAVPLLLLALALALAYWAVADARETARADFNQQQLRLARQAATRAEASLQMLQLELSSLTADVEASPDLAAALPPLLRGTLRRGTSTLMEVRYAGVLTGKTTYLRQRGKVADEFFDANDRALLQLPELTRGVNDQALLLDAPASPRDRPLLALAQAVEFNGAPGGVLYFLVDGRQLAASAVGDVSSGRTGYAWLADASGQLLAHPASELVGQNLFQAVEGHQPLITFDAGAAAQRQRFLSGQEGTGTYFSGIQDLDDDRPKEKLVAFVPIQAGGQGAHRYWLAAVVAPAGEAEAGVNALLLKLLAVLAVATAAVALAFVLSDAGQQRRAQALQHTAEVARQRFARSQERLRIVADASDDLILTLAEDGRILQANRAALRLLSTSIPSRNGQRSPEETLGYTIQDLLPESGEYLRREASEALRQRRATTREHSILLGAEEHWFSTKLRPLPEADDRPSAVLAVCRDLTQKRQIDDLLCNTEKLAALGTLAAGVAHEINNPLTSILGYADLLLEKFPRDSQEHKDLETIERCGQHCRLIVENLLDYARIGTNLGETTNLNDDVEAVLALVDGMLLTNKIVLERHLDPKLPPISANSKEMQQVLLNLINNAIHAMRKGGGTLTASTAVRGNRLMASVADTGCGIPTALQDKIFTPFFTTKDLGEGTGLGLSVSLGLVQKLGGTITFTSSTGNRQKGEPSGSVFTTILPLPAEEVVEA